MSYRNLEIWQIARELTVEIHRMSLDDLPSFELYEEGSQIRRSIKSVRSNIVEGYGRRRYRPDWIRFLAYAGSSCDETTDHLEILAETGSLRNRTRFDALHGRLRELGRKINLFLQSLENNPPSIREDEASYSAVDRE